MPETSFVYRASADFGAVDRAISQTERNLERLRAQALTIEAAGGDRTQTNREIAEQRRILRSLRDKRQAIQETADEQEQIADEARTQGRVQRRATRAYRSIQRSLEQTDREARSILGRSASLARNLRDAGPAGLAGAGFATIRGLSTGFLGAAGVGAGAAGAIGGGLAVGAGLLAAPSVIGLLGTNAAVASEDLESLRRSLDAVGSVSDFTSTQQLIRVQDALRGTVPEAEALQRVIAIEKLGIPSLSQDISGFVADIGDIATATGESYDRIFASTQRFIVRGTFERIRDILPGLDPEVVRETTAGLSVIAAQAERARLVQEALQNQARLTGNQLRTEAQETTIALGRQNVQIERLRDTFGNFAQNFATDVRNRVTNFLRETLDLVDEIQGRVTPTQQRRAVTALGLSQEDRDRFVQAFDARNFQIAAQIAGLPFVPAVARSTRPSGERIPPQPARVEGGEAFRTSIALLNAFDRFPDLALSIQRNIDLYGALTANIDDLERIEGVERIGTGIADFGGFQFAGGLSEAQFINLFNEWIEQLQVTPATTTPVEERLPLPALNAIGRGLISGFQSELQAQGFRFRVDQEDVGAVQPFRFQGAVPQIDIEALEERLQSVNALLARSRLELRQGEIEAGIFDPEAFEDTFERFNAERLREQAVLRNQINDYRTLYPQASSGAEELSRSVVFLRETFVSSASEIIFNARSVQDVLQGLARSLFDIAAPELFNTVVSGITRR